MINYTQLRWTWINPSDKTLNGLSSMISEKKRSTLKKKGSILKKKSYFLPLLPPLISFNTLPTLTIFIILQCPFTSNEWYYQQQEVINIWVLAQFFYAWTSRKRNQIQKKNSWNKLIWKKSPTIFFLSDCPPKSTTFVKNIVVWNPNFSNSLHKFGFFDIVEMSCIMNWAPFFLLKEIRAWFQFSN